MMKKNSIVLFCFNTGICALLFMITNAAWGQLIVADTVNGTPAQQAEKLARMLQGNCVTVSNATLTCANFGWGTFTGTSVFQGMPQGVLLTTGRLEHALGPNNDASKGEDRSQPGNPDLNLLAAPNQTKDACVLEFDVVPATDSLNVSYVLASEEYPEFTCSPATDVFGIFLSGPGITGNVPGNANLRNIAMVPNSTQMTSINTIRPQNPGNAPCTPENEQYYVDNGTGATPVVNTQMQYDGYTKTLTASITGLVPNATYHIMFGVADVLDGLVDTGLFIAQGSLSSSVIPGCTTTLAIPAFQKSTVRTLVFPNPATGQTKLSITGLPIVLSEIEVQISDILGRVVIRQLCPTTGPGAASFKFDAATLGSGVYHYRILNNDKLLKNGRFVTAH